MKVIKGERATKVLTLFYAAQVTHSYGREVAMDHEQKKRDEPEHEQPRQPREEKPQTWKHPDDGTELSELDQERPLKP
ncbi:hypothetical protein BK648_04970 [Pseudomonas poae]|uniref:Uncharacterized protein n=1 Tax=Pseudomonas poae TaxID=200451 RepID=A0A423FJH3_9PSED|nr:MULTISPECIES: hypothetical protein [Pseudomonas]ROM58113.1 hypothetical protein BK648_04970 [Pseudomonas poae]TFF09078.1 hypothetical protein EXW71_18085 [Pseudomonas sp. BCA17]TFF09472.1 hypothetical protein EXW70_10545 [Pseudomonas sp. JMN1]TFF28391.1 hypothetical protein EXW72_09045 [Pseudomonas sp. BCA14]TFF29294.1 hypothetical protein EXW73_08760 [Pseudomonas sp. BCA13]